MGAYRSQPDKTKSSFSKTYKNIQYAVCHMCGWRLYMEDAALQQLNFNGQNHHLFAIFDGHGGGQVAIFVKNHFLQELTKNQNFIHKNYQQALQQTFQKMDKLLRTQKGQWQIKQIQNQLILQDNLPKRDQKGCAGSTALVCLMAQRMFFISNAGDSQAFAKKNGRLIRLNNLHSPTIQSEKERIQQAGGYVSQQGRIGGCLNVSRTIGDLDFKDNKKLASNKQMVISFPQVFIESQQNIQYIIMGCDGIWQQKQPREIAIFIQQRMKLGLKLDKILEQLQDWLICKQQQSQQKQQGKDNMSVIFIRFKDQHLSDWMELQEGQQSEEKQQYIEFEQKGQE